MQSLATYSLVHPAPTLKEARALLSECVKRVNEWLESKGTVADSQLILKKGGRKAGLTTARFVSTSGDSKEWELTEPLSDNPDAEFRTNLQLAQKDTNVYLYFTLKAGYRSSTIAPELHLQVKPPRILFDLANISGSKWQFGSMPVGLKPLAFNATHAEMVASWLSQPDRPMPIVAFSEYEGEILHPQPDWQEKVAERLFGMALVIRFSADLSWELTSRVGKKWSCFHGAVRIYWPKLDFNSDPFQHDLMIAEDIMGRFNTDNRRIAANGLLDHLYDRFRRISTYSVRCPSVFPDLRRECSQERITDLHKQVASKRDATKAAANLAASNKRLTEELAAGHDLMSEYANVVRRLEDQLLEAKDEITRIQNAWDIEKSLHTTTHPNHVAVQHQAQITTIFEAIERAKTEFADDLLFGSDVNNEAKNLKEDAGPPTKVYVHLMKLAEASRALQHAVKHAGTATLGRPICEWLTENGAAASGEYQKTMDSKGKRDRTWDFANGTNHTFTNHTKPSEATSPNQCVRIYFDWCPNRKKIIVGSIGRKPGL